MRLIQQPVSRVPLSVVLVVGFFCLVAPGIAWAGGPVPPGGLPGGVTVVDDDAGPGQPTEGEQWGRPGGRTMTFTVNNPGGFTALSWGVVSGMSPGAAFDGYIDPSEALGFNAGESDLMNGVARWTGEAQIELVDTTPSTLALLQTRFTLSVTNGGGTVPLAFVPGAVNPGIDVKSAGPFTANLFFEAFYPASIGGDDSWWPILDLFDLLPTDPVGDGFYAQTAASTGFYFLSEEALSLEEHDLNISSKIDSVKNDTEFLKIDTVGRFQDLTSGLVTLMNQVSAIPTADLSGDLNALANLPTDLSALANQVSAIPTVDLSDDLNLLISLHQQGGESPATPEDVQAAKDELADILMILFGLAPCPPEAGPVCETATFIDDLATQANLDMVNDALPAIQEKLDAIQAALEVVPDGSEVRVEVVEISDQSTSQQYRQWLVKTTRDGSLVDAALTRLLAIRATHGELPIAEDITAQATATPLATGLQEVFLEVGNGADDTHAYQFEVYLDGETPANGSALVDRSLSNPVKGKTADDGAR